LSVLPCVIFYKIVLYNYGKRPASRWEKKTVAASKGDVADILMVTPQRVSY